jgi:hypothetical protein
MTGWQLRSVTRAVTLRFGKVMHICPVVTFSSPSVIQRIPIRDTARRHDHMIKRRFPAMPGAQRSNERTQVQRADAPTTTSACQVIRKIAPNSV